MTRVLLVEDDETHRLYGEVVLRRAGYDVAVAETGAAARQAAELGRVDVILLDVGLPDIDGIELCKQLRARTDAPIIFVSSRTDDAAKVLGLDAGADDFVSKPFSVAELTARIRAVLRRHELDREDSSEQLQVGGILLDLAAHRVLANGEEIVLTPTEFELLKVLISVAGRVVSRRRILEAVWGPDYIGDANVLDVHMSQLRRKLPGDPPLIRTVRGVGFCFSGSSLDE